MPIDVPTSTNTFLPTSSRPGGNRSAYWSDYTNSDNYRRGYTDLKGGLGSSAQRVQDFLEENGASNPPFNASTAGRLTPNQGGGSKKITRGFIRRSSPNSGDPASTGQLNFMYNPTEIIRDYTSYLDQTALDPFNTVYDSGNLVHAPSFINFNFQLLFDRQIEASDGSLPNGVLADYEYFDMVVRNVPPGSDGANSMPDNGVMMVNPQDITVVFSGKLSVQGRPTNARVQFVKFDSKMVPTRMVISLTMIITYFGPLRQAIGYDAYQDTGDYSALVPYSEIYSETYTEEQLRVAEAAYASDLKLIKEASALAPKLSPYSVVTGGGGAYGQVVGVQGITGPANSHVAQATLQSALQIVTGPPVPTYKLGTKGPLQYDCSAFVSEAYSRAGAIDVLGGRGNTTSILDKAEKQTSGMRVVHRGGGQGVLSTAQPGDLFMVWNVPGESNHIGFIESVDLSRGRLNIIHMGSNRKPGGVGRSTRGVGTTTRVLRPMGTGANSAGGNPGGAHWR